ncbi:MAG TPA: hypothetical protein VM074_02800 [Solimonas sp.]|nr:hypothetical protein [Solimonas sp.]
MHLVQLLLPLYDNAGEPQPRALFAAVRDELVQRFGGLTAYTRAPAKGVWEEDDGRQVRDDLVIYEVLAEALDPAWWKAYRQDLERRFGQEELLVHAGEVRRL